MEPASAASTVNPFELPPTDFAFYMEHPTVAALSEREVAMWRSQHRIEISDRRAPKLR